MNRVLSEWISPIDISDGELRSDNGFYSYNLTISHWNIAEKFEANTEYSLMIWAVYKVIHELAKKNFIDGNYMVDVILLDHQEILKEYKKVLKDAK